MSHYIPTIIIIGAIFLALIINLSMKKEYTAKMIGCLIAVASVGGIIIYGYGYFYNTENIPLTILRSIIALFGIFTGKNDFSAVSGTPLFQSSYSVFFFWFVHFMAQYATASAVVATIGTKALRRLRLWLINFGELSIIFGINDNSISFGKALLKQKNHSIVFVDDSPSDKDVSSISSAGAAIMGEKSATTPDINFLKSIGLRRKNRIVNVYAIHNDSAKNITFANCLMEALEQAEIPTANTNLVLASSEGNLGYSLQAFEDRYGFGNVTILDEAAMSARLLIQAYPPCNTIDFDENGIAKQNFEALVIGFGKVGQAVVNQLIMNGQFIGSKFSLTVFAPDCDNTRGYYSISSHGAIDNYDIKFIDRDARSIEMYKFLNEKYDTLKYIAVCVGDDALNSEIADDIQRYLNRKNSSACVYQCSHNGVIYCKDSNTSSVSHKIYVPEILCTDKLDRISVMLNHFYCSNDKTPLENWTKCDYFSRLSNRASADFIPAYLKIAGVSAEESVEKWTLSKEMLENMGHTEHLRWCAFHYVMGYEKMPDDIWQQRAEQYKKEKKENGQSSIRIGKDVINLYHACLIPWEELDELSAKENSFTGKNVDYKQMDINNILAVPQLIKSTMEQ